MQGSAAEGNGAATDRFDLAGQLLPFVCDGRVDEEKLYELLNAGAEFSALDFKQTLVLAEPKKKLDFVKDCAAMMNLPGGGYIVVGATDDGQLVSEIEPPKKAMFDSASLGEIVRGYVDSHVDIRAQFHPQVRTGSGTGPMVLIYVAPPPDGLPAVISQDGTWTGNGRPKAVFHAGTVFVRRGTSNSVATHQSWAWILENYRNRVRTEAQSDVQVLVRRVVEQMGAGVREEPVAPDVAMDPDTFV
ncbi:AlbA family DNA-binding domain-containing protein [Microbacterium sp. A93]|uniref:AlbA family DNA-binding domain-containing protein n=1 Tax=Microbacterium sp. A93 TaxID=3450716 RepID=UPI003F42A72A